MQWNARFSLENRTSLAQGIIYVQASLFFFLYFKALFEFRNYLQLIIYLGKVFQETHFKFAQLFFW